MNCNTKFIGLDVSKESIAVVVADWSRKPARYWGQTKNTFEEVRKLMERIGELENLLVCYEARPTGYELYRGSTKSWASIALLLIPP